MREMNTEARAAERETAGAAVWLHGAVQLRKAFRLGPLNLEAPVGCVTAIVGPNGSGKSSTFRLLLGLTAADEGEIRLLGERVGDGLDDTELKRRMAYVPEEDSKIEASLRGTSQAEFVSAWYPDWNQGEFERLLREFEVEPSKRLGKMSKGMRRKFELALALAREPELLLLDEPSSGLDPLSWRKLVGELHRYMERGRHTILMATHILDEVKRLADYIAIMADGRIIGVYEKDELLSSWHRFYVGPGLGGAVSEGDVADLPGLVQAEESGGGTCRVVTSRAWEAEGWCRERGLPITGQRALELDEIMEQLIRQAR
ncbi:ABC transporter ATP-binding protein [Paenibacillus sp. FSL W8-1187]|uniref:ABC transporter ATP-binding protein n=1 Tax=unclassified Paenibacillus TaxID=185978 RepID=UPI001E35CF7F|nr:ABC transporter ATP-binding protein [Paenibacillus sp. B01]